MRRKLLLFLGLLLPLVLGNLSPLAAQRGADRYALILEDPPLARQIESRKELRRGAAMDLYRKIEAAQESLRGELRQRAIPVTGSVNTLVNAVFVRASKEQLAGLRKLPGVARIAPLPIMRRHLNRAANLVNVRGAWTDLGGEEAAGSGVKIGILDTGIDQTHPAFQDGDLTTPQEYPKCRPDSDDCAYTNNKVIVARSYVDMLVIPEEPAISRPDDLSPRDRVGHGTAAAMIAAGATNIGPAATITGVAPKAWLGNYKIFGSPGVNDFTFADVFLKALDDAYRDGMDIVSISAGGPALWGPLDAGPTCGLGPQEPCDLRAEAVQTAVEKGMVVVISAGNDGDVGSGNPTLNTIHTPGSAPAAITVGATTNSHVFYASVGVPGEGVPVSLQSIPALFGDGPSPSSPYSAPLRDVRQLGDDGFACSPLALGSLEGAIALIQRGECLFSVKINHAQEAGAVGVALYQSDGSDFIFQPVGLAETGIPAALIGNTDGVALREFLPANPDRTVTFDPELEESNADSDTVADFSSRGPSIGNGAIKPELVAVGTDMYTATQRFDPNGDLYDPSGYTATQGTSFAAPLVAGAAALVQHRHQNLTLTPAQIKSLLVNTATILGVDEYIDGLKTPARVTALGAGKLDVTAAVRSKVTIEPSVLSFGVIQPGPLPAQRALTLTNIGNSAIQLNLSVIPRDQGVAAKPTLDRGSLLLNPGMSNLISVSLDTSVLSPGSYAGVVEVLGGGTTLHVPYLYVVGNATADDIFPLGGSDFVGVVSDFEYIAFKLIDRFGAPVEGAPVQFRAVSGGGTISPSPQRFTDSYGIAEAEVQLGPLLGEQRFEADAGGLTLPFSGLARLLPTLNNNGVVNAASLEEGQGLAPGSFVFILGQGLSEATRVTSTLSLPLSLAGVSVSFDAPSAGLSLPGRLHFVSQNAITVQIPWELEGLNAVQMKVSIGAFSSDLYEIPLAVASPAAFEINDSDTGRLFAAALDTDYALIGDNNPALRGSVIQIFANGLGPVAPRPPSGEPTPFSPLATTTDSPIVTIGGLPAAVEFSGLSPGSVGLCQINVRVPDGLSAGTHPVVISIQGISSKSANLPIQ